MRHTVLFAAASLIALSLAAAPAHAQQDELLAASESLQAAQQRAEAEAIRAGDEALSCEQMEAEIIAVMSTPEVNAAMQESAANSTQMEEQAQQQQRALRGAMATNLAMGVAGQFVPGLGLLSGMMMRNQMQTMTTDSQEQMVASFRNMEAIMPAMMRTQRLTELAQARQCAFVSSQLAP